MQDTLYISSIYVSIQEKSRFSGLPFIFIRISECNLSCINCPVKNFLEKGKWLTFTEIEYILKTTSIKNIEITGGEPLLQKSMISFIDFLIEKDYDNIILKTNGTMSLKGIPSNVVKIVDCKTPSTGEDNSFYFPILRDITKRDIVRFIISEERDYIWTKAFVEEYKLPLKCEVLLAIDEAKIDRGQIINWVLKDKLKVRIGPFFRKTPRMELFKA